MALDLQPKLLRVLDQRVVPVVGGGPRRVEILVIPKS